MGSSPQMQPFEKFFESIPGLGDALKTVFQRTDANGGNSGGSGFGDIGGAGSSMTPPAIPTPSMWPGMGGAASTAAPAPSIPATDPASMGGGVGAPVSAPTPSLGGVSATPTPSAPPSVGSWGGHWNAGGFGPSSQQDIVSKLLMQYNPSLGES